MAKHAVKTTKKLSVKAIVAVAAAAVMLCGMIGGTVAWLIDQTEEVINTFTYGDINIKLDESVIGEDGQPTTERAESGNNYKMVPGEDIFKDPMVTVEKGSEACYLFVKLVKSDATVGETTYGFDSYMTFEVADGWTALDGVDGVYYREVADLTNAENDVFFAVLKDNKVTVKEEVSKAMLNGMTDQPKLTITGYAVQQAGMESPADAWAAANPSSNS